jgi:peptidyl-prolyl cis-trans isomerase SurA
LDEMRKQMNLDSMEDLEKAAAQQGVSFEDFKADIKNNMLTQEVIGEEVGRHIQILPSEADKYYNEHKKEFEHAEQVHLEEILISTEAPAAAPGQTSAATPAVGADAAKAKATDLLEQVKKGANFEELAKKYSQDPTAEQAGDIGSFQRGQMAKEIEDQVFPLKAGQVAGPIQTKQGFILLKVVEHTPAGVPPYKDVEQQVMNHIYMEKLQPALRQYLTKLREEAYIDIKSGFVDSGASPNESKPTLVSGNTSDEKGAVKQGKRKKKLGIF